MLSAQKLVDRIEMVVKNEGVDSLLLNTYIAELRDIINVRIPEKAAITLWQKYEVDTGKKGVIEVMVTKENPKTWVAYELEDSSRPGCRWMLNKNWCTAERVRPTSSEAQLPNHVVLR